jgi:hypothetical protein
MLKHKTNFEELIYFLDCNLAEIEDLLKLIFRIDSFNVESVGDVAFLEIVIVSNDAEEGCT